MTLMNVVADASYILTVASIFSTWIQQGVWTFAKIATNSGFKVANKIKFLLMLSVQYFIEVTW